ncbi:MAG: SNase-domain-containing protein [Amphiamblys sp. WSBS2006]|nr:MAG: SNase-domain-containing protein [Amphiamblys sp. WSBS2006]
MYLSRREAAKFIETCFLILSALEVVWLWPVLAFLELILFKSANKDKRMMKRLFYSVLWATSIVLEMFFSLRLRSTGKGEMSFAVLSSGRWREEVRGALRRTQLANVLSGENILVAVFGALLFHGMVFLARAVSFRYRAVSELPESVFRRRTVLHGVVSSVGDGDGFRFRHVSFFELFRLSSKSSGLKETLSVRLAGVDAPETAHFGLPGQPFGEEAKRWLRDEIQGRRVRIVPHLRDQYGRAVCSVYYRPFLFEKNLSLEIVKSGLAEVYVGKGAVYGGIFASLLSAEKKARKSRTGMWQQRDYRSPGEYKQAAK